MREADFLLLMTIGMSSRRSLMTAGEYSVKSRPTCIRPAASDSGKRARVRRIEGLEIWPDVSNSVGV